MKLLVVTVGGSDSPVVSSILHNRPDYVYFFCSDDVPETKGSYHTVEGTGKPCGFVSVCPNCKSSSGQTRPSIVNQTGLNEQHYKVIKVRQFDDLNECYLQAALCIQEIRRSNPQAVIIADYTGGTKSMSAGLAAAAMDDGNVQICVVKGRRADLHKVKEGTQAARLIENNRVFIKKKLVLIENLWNNYDFQSCLEVIAEISSRPLLEDMQDRIDQLRYIIMGYEAWDRFDHLTASIHLKPFKSNEFLIEHYKMLGKLNRVMQCWPGNTRLDLSKSKKSREKLFSFDPVYDLTLNALRREKQGRYDDAVARIYRALEMFAQINLLRWEHPLNSAEIDISLLPESLKPKYNTLKKQDNDKIALALMSSYTLLSELDTPIGPVFDRHKPKLQNLLSKRNNSLMAHGINPVTETDCREALELFERFLEDALLSLGENKPSLPEMQIPQDLLKKASLL